MERVLMLLLLVLMIGLISWHLIEETSLIHSTSIRRSCLGIYQRLLQRRLIPVELSIACHWRLTSVEKVLIIKALS